MFKPASHLLNRLRRPVAPRTLIAIPTIDRDASLAPLCFAGIEPALREGADLMVLTRESDARVKVVWPLLWPKVLLRTVSDYDISGRHNCDALAVKRNLARTYAAEHGYDALFFVDSDVEIRPEIFGQLWACLRAGADVAFAAYAVRWYGNQPIVGFYDPASERFRVEEVSESGGVVWSGSAIGGMGCTLIHRESFGLPFEARSIQYPESQLPVTGEDIGFFLAAIKAGKRMCYLRRPVHHHLRSEPDSPSVQDEERSD